MKIPPKARTYPDAKRQRTVLKKVVGPFTYEPKKGEVVDVLYWHQWPSYDFIFGVPAKGSPYYKDEAAFFQFRDTRLKKVMQGCYVDMHELKVLVKGFAGLLQEAKRRLRK